MQLVPIIVTSIISLLFIYLLYEAYQYDKRRKQKPINVNLLGFGGIVSVGLCGSHCYATIYHDTGTYEVKVYTKHQVQCGEKIIINLIKDGKYYYV